MKKIITLMVMIISLTFFSFADNVFSKGGSFSGGGCRSSFSSSRSFSSPSRSFSSPSKSSFSFGGGSSTRSSNISSSPSKSFALFGGSNNKSTSVAPAKPSFDSSAAKAKSIESSKMKFDSYKAKTNPTINTGSTTYTTYNSVRGAPSYNYRPSSTNYYNNRGGWYTPSRTNVVYRDHYDNSFLQTASLMYLFHHWGSVDKSRFSDEKRKELEKRITELEKQGVKKDPNYIDPTPVKPIPEKKKSSHTWVWVTFGTLGLGGLGYGMYRYLQG